MTDVFESPTSSYTGDVKIGHAGRYVLPDPITGEERLWTRVSTIAKVLQDSFHLDKWHQRMVAKGMGIRPDLAELAGNLDVKEDKEELQDIADKAHEAAGGSIGANRGTALHGYVERLDGGEDLSKVRMNGDTSRALKRYQETMIRNGIRADPSFMERVVLNYEHKIVGRLDRILFCDELWPLPRIGDLKTQQTMDFAGAEMAIQLSLYAHADYIWNSETGEWETMPELDTNTAHVMHLPAGGDECEIYDVDVATGWKLVLLSMNVRKGRKVGKTLITPHRNDYRWRVQIMRAETRDDLSAIWKAAYAAGEWSKNLEQFGKVKLNEILAKEGV